MQLLCVEVTHHGCGDEFEEDEEEEEGTRGRRSAQIEQVGRKRVVHDGRRKGTKAADSERLAAASAESADIGSLISP